MTSATAPIGHQSRMILLDHSSPHPSTGLGPRPQLHLNIPCSHNHGDKHLRTATMTTNFILGFAAAAVVLQIIRLVLASWQHSRKARSLGCGSLPLYPSKDPLGIDNLKQSIAANNKNVLPQLTEKRVQIISDQENRYVETFILRNLGRNNVFTVDPKNIQAVLATQFKDFELGEARRTSIHPLLGTGIVSRVLGGSVRLGFRC